MQRQSAREKDVGTSIYKRALSLFLFFFFSPPRALFSRGLGGLVYNDIVRLSLQLHMHLARCSVIKERRYPRGEGRRVFRLKTEASAGAPRPRSFKTDVRPDACTNRTSPSLSLGVRIWCVYIYMYNAQLVRDGFGNAARAAHRTRAHNRRRRYVSTRATRNCRRPPPAAVAATTFIYLHFNI